MGAPGHFVPKNGSNLSVIRPNLQDHKSSWLYTPMRAKFFIGCPMISGAPPKTQWFDPLRSPQKALPSENRGTPKGENKKKKHTGQVSRKRVWSDSLEVPSHQITVAAQCSQLIPSSSGSPGKRLLAMQKGSGHIRCVIFVEPPCHGKSSDLGCFRPAETSLFIPKSGSCSMINHRGSLFFNPLRAFFGQPSQN